MSAQREHLVVLRSVLIMSEAILVPATEVTLWHLTGEHATVRYEHISRIIKKHTFAINSWIIYLIRTKTNWRQNLIYQY